jgi:nitroimidazol reductase NimA-like FMN-containing flavoprotein (pyridoxamine 5'-phosphate oxidase superfamily)
MLITRMQNEECRKTLQRLGFGRLACTRDNQPYIVPIYFAYEPDHLYGFATVGEKVKRMRSNPLVCVQSDEVLGNDTWISVIVFGRYEEIPNGPEHAGERAKAQSLLDRRPMWWQAAYLVSNIRGTSEPASPVFYRIHIEEISGLRASPEGSAVRVR